MTGDPPAEGEGTGEDRTRLVLSQPAATAPPEAPAPRGARTATVAIGTLINNNYIVREVLGKNA